MRVITGIAKGRKLQIPQLNNLRPTTDRVKEGIFSAIQFDVAESNFLDLFAGSGQMGIEALSRGAKSATFVDYQSKVCNVITQNIEITGFANFSSVVCANSIKFVISCNNIFDIAFLDPPYKTGILQEILPKLTRIISKNGIIICENPLDEDLPQNVDDFILAKVLKYGKIKVSIYKNKGCEY